MENFDESVDVESRDLHSTNGGDTHDSELNADEEESYSASSGDKSSETGDDASDNGNNDGDAIDSELNFDSITSDEIRAMEFATVFSEAYDFYYRYAKCKGFAFRKASSRIREINGNKITQMKQFVCNIPDLREKKHLTRLDRKLEHRHLSRTNSEDGLRVQYEKQKDRYVVTAFEECHNHELTPVRFVNMHPVYRKISEADKARIDGLQTRGIRTYHIMGYMIAQKGGYASVGFSNKDLYNYFEKKMRECIKDGDVVASLNYLNVKLSADPMLYVEYAVNNSDGRMKSLFWTDGSSRSDYFCFGDVIQLSIGCIFMV
ncbi:protein FAR1-RELATED SEQUENCE 5-like [Trifolium pratense]|uniref:protein FAR1-RELATED SEQUENCE 5-like n=1 Tax=Trifolium pratense TaxID=57577 RepID=UPI001E6950B9|nr:protein FAR1-RELATED SEQUENCE 5-like [Trifolium pratense]